MTTLNQTNTIASNKMTMEEFLRMAGNEHCQWIHGEAIAMAETPLLHSVIIGRLLLRIGGFVEQHQLGIACAESAHYLVTLDDGTEAIRQADVSFIPTDNPRQTGLQSPHRGSPPLAVEVVSAWDAPAKVNRKVRMWLSNGAQMVWEVQHDQHVVVHRPDQPPLELTVDQQLDGMDLLPGFSCEIAALYP